MMRLMVRSAGSLHHARQHLPTIYANAADLYASSGGDPAKLFALTPGASNTPTVSSSRAASALETACVPPDRDRLPHGRRHRNRAV